MSVIIAFILGVTLGVGIYFWREYQFNRQLRQMLNSLSKHADQVPSLSTLSLVRRTISRFKQQRQRLEEELQNWQELLEGAPIGYLRVDEENQLLWCNQQARQLLKIDRWQPGQVRLLLELVRSYELDRLIEQTRHSQQPQVQEWVFYATQYAPGEQLRRTPSLALKASSFPLPQGQVGVFLENQQPLVELSQSRDRAFSDLTHELRTPLTSICLVAEALQKRLQGSERRWVDQLLKEANRLIQLVQDWLEISQLEKDPRQHLHYQSIELRELIFSVWQTLEPLAKQKGVTLAYSSPDRLDLQADRSRLTQVFLNLFDNGIKHSPPNAPIRVEVNALPPLDSLKPDFWIQIEIIDSGSGFRESDLPYIFERLYRGDSSRTRQPLESQPGESPPIRRSSGLGLAIARQIIQAHGGSIQAKNHPETGGAWLQIKLPSRSGE